MNDFLYIQRVKVSAIPLSHQPAVGGGKAVSVAKALLPPWCHKQLLLPEKGIVFRCRSVSLSDFMKVYFPVL